MRLLRPEPWPAPTKPPLGIMPKILWKEERAANLSRAIRDYVLDGRFEEAHAWVEELDELLTEINFESDVEKSRHSVNN